jgi:hypothetical protein
VPPFFGRLTHEARRCNTTQPKVSAPNRPSLGGTLAAPADANATPLVEVYRSWYPKGAAFWNMNEKDCFGLNSSTKRPVLFSSYAPFSLRSLAPRCEAPNPSAPPKGTWAELP